MVATESDPNGYQPAVTHLLDATVADPRWSASWLCLGQLATMCGEYDHAQQYLMSGLEVQRRGPGFGYFLGFEMVLATVTQRRGDIGKARDTYASATASFESCDHVYREAFLALTACGLGELLRHEGHFDAALIEFRRASRLVKEYPRMLGRQRVLARTLAGMSAVCAAQGDSQRAGELLDQVASLLREIVHVPQSWIWEGFIGQLYYAAGAAYARLGKSEVALDKLEKAVASGWRDAHWLGSDPELAALRPQSRFQALLENVRLLPALEFNPTASLSLV
jgi:tetratricopeptide (TPR) repeat protein